MRPIALVPRGAATAERGWSPRFVLAGLVLALAACGSSYPAGSPTGGRPKVPCACPDGRGVEVQGGCDCTDVPPTCAPGDAEGCGGGESCVATADGARCVCACDVTWSCDGACACDRECGAPAGCGSDEDCDAASCQACEAGECLERCDDGLVCGGAGTCVAAPCDGPEDCYPTGFCGPDGACTSLAPLADCAAASAPAPEADGPVLTGGAQVELDPGGSSPWRWCRLEAECPRMANTLCAFQFGWYDPQDDVATSLPFDAAVRYLPRAGIAQIHRVEVRPPDQFVVYLCLEPTTTPNRGAVVLQDEASHRSNAVCLEGAF